MLSEANSSSTVNGPPSPTGEGLDNPSPLCYVAQIYGQLIREDNKSLDKTIVYEYNNIGCMNQNATSTTPVQPGEVITCNKTFTYDNSGRLVYENISYK